MAKKLPINELDKAFATNFIEEIDTATATIESEDDILDIIREYKNFMYSKIVQEGATWKTYEPLQGLSLKPGLCHIFGPPDTLKTYMGINIANWFSVNTDMSVLYIDAENKLWKRDTINLRDGVHLVAGRAETHNIVRKLVSHQAFQVIIVDTIVALSRYEDFLRNIIKEVDTQGLYIVLLNQTYAHNYDEIAAGNDVISELAYASHKITTLDKEGSVYYVSTDTGLEMAFQGDERSYSLPESLWRKAVRQELIRKEGDRIFYKGLEYSGKQAIMLVLLEEHKHSTQNVK